jgi:hypothetical protein
MLILGMVIALTTLMSEVGVKPSATQRFCGYIRGLFIRKNFWEECH